MLTKEKCLEAYNNLYDGSYDIGHDFQVDYDIIKQLINEHFDNPPLKFEDLKEDMWIWDKRANCYCKIRKTFEKEVINAITKEKRIENRIKFKFGEIAFEENRFYKYEVKGND